MSTVLLVVCLRCEEYLGAPLDSDHLVEVKFVRNVAPKKDMMRVSFRVPRHVLLSKTGSRRRSSSSSGGGGGGEEEGRSCKKLCTEEA